MSKKAQIYAMFNGNTIYQVDRVWVLTVYPGLRIDAQVVHANYDRIPKSWMRLIRETEGQWRVGVVDDPKSVSRYKSEDYARSMLTFAGAIGLSATLTAFDQMERPEFREHV